MRYSKNGDTLFVTGLFLINIIAGTLILSSVTFFCRGVISAWQFPAAVAGAALISYFISQQLKGGTVVFLKSLLAVLVILAISILAGSYFYDVSYDGQAYHQEGIYQLKTGWNPYFSMLPNNVNQALYINHYSKGVEIPQSAIYSTFHHIEAGKATNMMLLAAAFCLTLSLLYKIEKLSSSRAILLSLLITLNPIAIDQLLTFYVDGQLATLLLCLLVAGVMVLREPARYHLILLGAIIMVTVNIKFTAVVYVLLFTLAMLAWAIFAKKISVAKKLVYTALIAGLAGVVMIGYNPYIVNTVKYQHPFYPLMGNHKIDIISYNLPHGFKEKGGMEKLFISVFSHTGNITPLNGEIVSLKVPFTMNKGDIANAPKVDTRIGGFGPLFSGILLLSFALFIIIYTGAVSYAVLKNALYLVVALAISVLIIPESWWARYVPQFWFIPVIILLAAELVSNKRSVKIIKPILYVLIFLNIGFSLVGIGWNFLMTSLINYQLAELAATHKTITVDWGSAKSNRVRFQEHGIPYSEAELDNQKTESVIHSDSEFLNPGNNIDLPKSALIKWAEKFQAKDEK